MSQAQTQEVIASKDNALFKRLRLLTQDGSAYKKEGVVWLEGDHLCRALLARGLFPEVLVYAPKAQSKVESWGLSGVTRKVCMSAELLRQVSTLESPAPMGCLWRLPVREGLKPDVATVVLDRLQDPGNVGSVLRTAAAMGFKQVLALKGSAALWSPKVMRAGMGAHFGLHLVEGITADDLQALQVPLLATHVHEGQWLHQARLPWPCAWLMGHEGQGVAPELEAMATSKIRIAQPGGEESLNVAAAAAVCLYASAAQNLE